MPQNESEIYPYSLTDLSCSDALIIAPHPDDESLGCGGSIVKHINSGSRVKVIFLTDGGSGDFKGRFGDRYVGLRKSSASKAMNTLGVEDYEFWGYRDRDIASVVEEITDRLNQTIKGFSPDLIYVPSPFEVHPDHKTTSMIGQRIFNETGVDVIFYEVIVALYPNILVDITAEMEKKREAIKSYQTELHYNDYLSKIEGLNRFRSLTLPETITFAEGFILYGKNTTEDALCLRLFSTLL
jgi:LmbE family N-acetylglucosaminyl deacetylase